MNVDTHVKTKFVIDQGAGNVPESPSITGILYAAGVLTSTQPIAAYVLQVGNSSDLGDSAMSYMGLNQ